MAEAETPKGDLIAGLGRVVIVIPTYDEAANLAWIVGRMRRAQPGVDVLVVDDNSPDGTGDVADGLAADDAQVHVLHRTAKGGLGAATWRASRGRCRPGTTWSVRWTRTDPTSPSSCTGCWTPCLRLTS